MTGTSANLAPTPEGGLLRISAGAIVYFASPRLMRRGIWHAFSTRIGGISPPPRDTLSFGSPAGQPADPPETIAEAWRRLLNAAGFPELHLPTTTSQVHGRDVAEAPELPPGTCADALISRTPGLAVAVRVADCCPILLASEDGRQVAAVHAGWRGLVAGVIEATVKQLGVPPTSLVAAIGPCIGPDAFEVGPEVAEAFSAYPGRIRAVSGSDRSHADLAGACCDAVGATGVQEVDCAHLCTFENEKLFFSHRRDQGNTGRMVAVIAPAGA